MALDVTNRARFNLKSTSILLVEQGAMGMDILVQILGGFGARAFTKCDNIAAAKNHIATTQFDLIIVDVVLAGDDGYDLVHWLRRSGPDNNKFAPLIMIAPHTPVSKVSNARDSGAHFIISKPLTPIVMLERIIWVAKEQRQFVEAGSYIGPDRRFKAEGPPQGSTGRRADDLRVVPGGPTDPNTSQDHMDAPMQPKKVIP